MGVSDTIKEVAGFADQTTKPELDHVGWSHVAFSGGEVWARSQAGGALRKVDLPLEGAVPAKALLRALRACKGDPSFDQAGDVLTLSANGSKVKLQTRKVGSLPKLNRPPAKVKWLEVVGLDEAKRVAWCTSTDTSRRHLGGIYVDHRGLTTTNGSALAHLELETGLPEKQDGFLMEPAMLKGLPPLAWLCAEGGAVYIAEEKAKTGFRVAGVIQHQFPPYDAILGQQRPDSGFRTSKEDFIDLAKRAKLSYHQASIEVCGQELRVVVNGEPMDSLFSFMGVIPVEPVAGLAMPEGRIGLDLTYLLPALESVEGDSVECAIELSDKGGLSPAFFSGGRFTGVVMPYRM
jgi:DNA polymerase III sliding clamp (beta) subunit (PCNA family)